MRNLHIGNINKEIKLFVFFRPELPPFINKRVVCLLFYSCIHTDTVNTMHKIVVTLFFVVLVVCSFFSSFNDRIVQFMSGWKKI